MKGFKSLISERWYVGGSDFTGAFHIFEFWLLPLPLRHFLLQQSPGWFDILVPTYLGCPGNWKPVLFFTLFSISLFLLLMLPAVLLIVWSYLSNYGSLFLSLSVSLYASFSLWFNWDASIEDSGSSCSGFVAEQVTDWCSLLFVCVYVFVRSCQTARKWWKRWRHPWSVTNASLLSWGTSKELCTRSMLKKRRLVVASINNNINHAASRIVWLGGRVVGMLSDQQVVSSNQNHSLPTVQCNLGQVVNTHVPVSPSSIICYQPMSYDALRLGR